MLDIFFDLRKRERCDLALDLVVFFLAVTFSKEPFITITLCDTHGYKVSFFFLIEINNVCNWNLQKIKTKDLISPNFYIWQIT